MKRLIRIAHEVYEQQARSHSWVDRIMWLTFFVGMFGLIWTKGAQTW